MQELERALTYDFFAGDRGDPGDRCFRDRIVEYRKQHKCVECLATIYPHSKGRSITMLWEGDGRVVTYKFCLDCTAAMAEFETTDNWDTMSHRADLREARQAFEKPSEAR